MAYQTNYSHEPSGLKLANSYHRIVRLNLDQVLKAATIGVAIYVDEGSRRANKQPISNAEFVCQNRQVAPTEPPTPGETVPPVDVNDYDKWFGVQALENADPFTQAYGYLRENVALYKEAAEA